MSFVALIEAALRFLEALLGRAAEERGRGLGRVEALSEALNTATAAVALAREVEAEADDAHRKDPTDAALDREFERRD